MGSRDPGISTFSIPDPGIENSVSGLQSLSSTLAQLDNFLFTDVPQ